MVFGAELLAALGGGDHEGEGAGAEDEPAADGDGDGDGAELGAEDESEADGEDINDGDVLEGVDVGELEGEVESADDEGLGADGDGDAETEDDIQSGGGEGEGGGDFAAGDGAFFLAGVEAIGFGVADVIDGVDGGAEEHHGEKGEADVDPGLGGLSEGGEEDGGEDEGVLCPLAGSGEAEKSGQHTGFFGTGNGFDCGPKRLGLAGLFLRDAVNLRGGWGCGDTDSQGGP